MLRNHRGIWARLSVVLTSTTLWACSEETDPVAPPPPPVEETRVIGWNVTASNMAGEPGTMIKVVCEPNGRAGSIWGTLVYTDDSSICTAAAHAGLIGVVAGGEVSFTIHGRQVNYPGTTKFGITSSSYGAWNRGFSFSAVTAMSASWTMTMTSWRNSPSLFTTRFSSSISDPMTRIGGR